MRVEKSGVLVLIIFTILICVLGCIPAIKPSTSTQTPNISATFTTPAILTPSSSMVIPTSSTVTIPTYILSPSPMVSEFVQAPIVIDNTFNGKEIHANLVKFTGLVSSPDTSVLINENQAIMNADGSYYTYLDLIPGRNNIVIKTTKNNQTINSGQVAIIFNPPLIIKLNWPFQEDDIDYTKVPITINGIVSNPAAKVEINQKTVNVNGNGTFFIQSILKVGANPFLAVATLGDDMNKDSVTPQILKNGRLASHPPGLGGNFSRAYFGNGNPINVKIGGTTTANIDVIANTELPFTNSNNFSANIIRTSQPNESEPRDTLAPISGLSIDLIPQTYKLYPRIEYHSSMEIKTDSILLPGDYYFTIEYNVQTGHGENYIIISAKQ
jgi:hypothetical protein